MDCEHIRVLVPTPVETPRGAEWAANAVVWILHGAVRGASLLRRWAVAPKGDPRDRNADPAGSSNHVARRSASGVAQ